MRNETQTRGRVCSSLAHKANVASQFARLPGFARRSNDPERALALVCRKLFDEPSKLLQLGRFELTRTLGRGGMGVVYEAFDPLHAERIALKMLHGHEPTHVCRLKREFRALAGLRHPNLVALHDLFVAEDGAYFSMELIQGRDFTSYTCDVDDARLNAALRQLCEGVHALHGAGKLHRDLKPQNVLVTETGRVVLLDFGLVDDVSSLSGSVAGTPAYMAPEQAEGQACESSDWYGFGTMLRLTLQARRARRHSIPRSLERLTERLTDRTAAWRPGFAEIVAVLGDALPSLREPRAKLVGACESVVGREAELRWLAEAYEHSKSGPVLVSVRGEAGVGKTTLLRQFVSTTAVAAHALVFSGRCYERESVPYNALDGVMDELSRYLLSLPSSQADRLCPEHVQALLQMFPVLARVPAMRRVGRSAARAHPLDLRTGAVAALKLLLQSLAVKRPLLMCIDDLQWSDADSGRLLGSLLCADDAPPLLVLCSHRGGPQGSNPALEEILQLAGRAPCVLDKLEFELGRNPR